MKNDNRKKLIVVLIVVAIIFIAYGIFRGDHLDVLKKATKICFECIGIG